MFAFTLTTTSNEYNEIGDVLFTNTGDTIGRILRRSITEISEDEFYCCYDIETSEDMYKAIESGSVQVSGFNFYKVSSGNISYVNNNSN